jgi:aspartate aminotransferase-like enzyme
MLKRYLLAPGPTPVPPEVLLAMAKPMIHHRAPEFDKLFGEVREDLKWLFQTRNDVLMLASSGTGGMEGAVSNFLSPGDKAISINGGKFGERWTKLCKTFGAQVHEIKVEWGRAVDRLCAGQRNLHGRRA